MQSNVSNDQSKKKKFDIDKQIEIMCDHYDIDPKTLSKEQLEDIKKHHKVTNMLYHQIYNIPYIPDLSFEEYLSFLTSKKTEDELKIIPDTDELRKITDLKTKQDLHRYILRNNKELSIYDSYIMITENILKVLPVVVFSSLPLLIISKILTNTVAPLLFLLVYSIMGLIIVIFLWGRIYLKNKLLLLNLYYDTAIMKYKEP